MLLHLAVLIFVASSVTVNMTLAQTSEKHPFGQNLSVT
jgi:hypothetical protein